MLALRDCAYRELARVFIAATALHACSSTNVDADASGAAASVGSAASGGGGAAGQGGGSLVGSSVTSSSSGTTSASSGGPAPVAVFYVTSDDGSLYGYLEDTWASAGHWTGLPITDGVRGVDVDPQSGVLYVAHGGDGGQHGPGRLLAWSLVKNAVLYDVGFSHGVDMLGFGNGKLYVPEGEATISTTWHVVDAATGAESGIEAGGDSPHNTIVRNGHRYYGGRYANELIMPGFGAGAVGPTPSGTAGVRPFTVNANETRVWITWTLYRGFSVGDTQTGALLKSVNFGALPPNFTQSTASHGVSLSPDGAEVYVLDMPTDSVRVYDGSDDPQLLATIPLQHGLYGGAETPCAYDCPKVGWLLHSRDGKYVYVGDSGDVIDTSKHVVAQYLAPLHENRHGFVEVDWTQFPGGTPTSTTTHFGMGH